MPFAKETAGRACTDAQRYQFAQHHFLNRALQPAVSLFAIGLAGLGVLALIYRDFALTDSPYPPGWTLDLY